jgi:hypothetical protein
MSVMEDSRIAQAMARIEAALARIAAAQASHAPGAVASVRVIELVNTHEKLREEVAETLRDLDTLIEQLEG